MPKPLNLIGQTFGNWEVLEKGQSKNGKVYWICRCKKCNIIKEVQATSLRNGRSQSCGKCSIDEENINYNAKEKICEICGKSFTTIKYGQNRKYCFECSPYSYKEQSKNITAIRTAIKKQLVKYKGGKCEICGYNKSLRALQFHHINPEEKDFSISNNLLNGHFNMNDFYNEIDKCKLLCANCHAEEHERLDKNSEI